MQTLMLITTIAVLLGVSFMVAISLGHAMWRDTRTRKRIRKIKHLIVSRSDRA